MGRRHPGCPTETAFDLDGRGARPTVSETVASAAGTLSLVRQALFHDRAHHRRERRRRERVSGRACRVRKLRPLLWRLGTRTDRKLPRRSSLRERERDVSGRSTARPCSRAREGRAWSAGVNALGAPRRRVRLTEDGDGPSEVSNTLYIVRSNPNRVFRSGRMHVSADRACRCVRSGLRYRAVRRGRVSERSRSTRRIENSHPDMGFGTARYRPETSGRSAFVYCMKIRHIFQETTARERHVPTREGMLNRDYTVR